MHATSSVLRHQQKRIQDQLNQSDIYSFFNVLTSDDLLSHVEETLPEHRERQFPPTETLAMFLSQALNADRSCQRVVNEAATNRLLGDPNPAAHPPEATVEHASDYRWRCSRLSQAYWTAR